MSTSHRRSGSGLAEGLAKAKGFVYSLVLAAILASSFPASAHYCFWSGNDLVKGMRAYEKSEHQDGEVNQVDVSVYKGFVFGAHDSLSANGYVCSDDRVTSGQVFAVVAKYLNAHPEEWNKSAAALVTAALKQAFPCKK